MGATMRSTVRKAARLAVYEEMRMREKNHQTPPVHQLVILFMDPTKVVPKFINSGLKS